MIPSADDCRIVLKNKNDKRKYSLCKWMHPFVYREGNKNHFDFLRRTLRKTLRRGHQVGVKDSTKKPLTSPVAKDSGDKSASISLTPQTKKSAYLDSNMAKTIEDKFTPHATQTKNLFPSQLNTPSTNKPRITFNDSVEVHDIPFVKEMTDDDREDAQEARRVKKANAGQWRRIMAMENPGKYGLDDDAARGVTREKLKKELSNRIIFDTTTRANTTHNRHGV